MKTTVSDYRIYQRNEEGYAEILYEGSVTEKLNENSAVFVCVKREIDGTVVIPHRLCSLISDGDEVKWTATLSVPEGGLYTFEAILSWKQATPAELSWSPRIHMAFHVGVGDLWIMAGQSNMTGYGRDNAYDPPVLGVHNFGRNGVWGIATHPLCLSIESPYGYAGENSTGSSPALSFARRLKEALNIPIGLLPAAIGGTALALWNGEKNGVCDQRMFAMLADVGEVKGMIWYQGCSDCSGRTDYLEEFREVVASWRKRIRPDLPILTVQLGRWTGGGTVEEHRRSGLVKDAQRRAALTINGVSVVPALDLTTTDGIHNSAGSNVILGERLANTALVSVYGRPGQTAPLVLSCHRVDDTHFRVDVTPGHSVIGIENIAFGMNIEDPEGLANCTKAEYVKDGILVECERAFASPAYFHYAWGHNPPAFFARDAMGMPLPACYQVPIEEN